MDLKTDLLIKISNILRGLHPELNELHDAVVAQYGSQDHQTRPHRSKGHD